MLVLASFTAVNVLSATVIVLEVTALMTKSLLFSVLEVQPESVTPSPALNFVVKSAQPFTVILLVANVALLPVISAANGFTVWSVMSRYTLSGHITILVFTTANCFLPAVTVPTVCPSYSREVPSTATSLPHDVSAVTFWYPVCFTRPFRVVMYGHRLADKFRLSRKSPFCMASDQLMPRICTISTLLGFRE